jgi:UDP-glucose 4-epimerase
MIHAGSGVIHAGAYEALRRVAERLHAPVTTSWAARGVLTETSPLAIPMPHVKLNHKVRNDADVVLIVGSRVGETDWWGKPPYWRHPSQQQTIQVDIDGDMLGLNKPADLAVAADAKLFLEALALELDRRQGELQLDGRRTRVAGYTRQMKDDREGWDKALTDMSVPMHPAHIGAVCREVFPQETVLVADGGNATIWAMFYHRVTVPNTLLSTFKFGMLGAGMAQAIGAAVARPGQPVCCIIGDGAFGFHPQEVETAVRNKAQVVYVVLCDKQWGMVKMNQQFMLRPFKTMLFKHLDADETIKADLGEIEFDKLGRFRPHAAETRAAARSCRRQVRGDPCGRRPGQAHVGAGAAALQEDARGAQGLAGADVDAPNVLVTGAAGYVGAQLIEALAQGRIPVGRIVAADVRDPPADGKFTGVEYVQADVRAPDLAALFKNCRPDVVVHLASIVTPGKDSDREFEYSVDVLGTRNVLEACLVSGVKKIIISSSGAAYGYRADNPAWIGEDCPLLADDAFAYAWHKRLVEEMLAAWRIEHPELQQVVLRIGTILGATVHNQITALFDKPRLIAIRGSDSPFVFIWDQDVVGCILHAIAGDKTGIYNVAGDGALTVREIAALLGKRRIILPAWLLQAALALLKALGLTQYGPEQVNFLRYRPVLDNARLKREFGYVPQLTSAQVFDLYRRRKGA